ncbi:MAG: hypothetical protein QM724_12580 [Flavobacteriales bacterium]
MRSAKTRTRIAVALLGLMALMVLPRTLFHHCERVVAHAEADVPASGGVHVDGHCAICEAPAPVHEGAFAFTLVVDEMELGTAAPACLALLPLVTPEAPRLRGPPVLA